MSTPMRRQEETRRPEAGRVLLLVAVALFGFGLVWLLDWRHPVIAVVLAVGGLALAVTLRRRETWRIRRP